MPGFANGTAGTTAEPTGSDGVGQAGSSDVAPVTTENAAGASGSGGGECMPRPVSAQCGVNPQGAVPLQTMNDLSTAMVHRWLLCGNESAFAVDGGDIGIEITQDNHWYKLYLAEGGSTVRGAGFDEEGTWEALDLVDHFQVNFQILGSGTVITAPVFATTPPAMRLDNNGVFRGDYVLDPAIPEGSARCATGPDPSRSGACEPALESAIAVECPDPKGRWARCGGSMPGAPTHDGIEVDADGSFYFLHRDAKNALVHTPADRAMAEIDNACRGQFNVSLSTASGATILSSAQIRVATPRQLWIFTEPESGDPERYNFDGP